MHTGPGREVSAAAEAAWAETEALILRIDQRIADGHVPVGHRLGGRGGRRHPHGHDAARAVGPRRRQRREDHGHGRHGSGRAGPRPAQRDARAHHRAVERRHRRRAHRPHLPLPRARRPAGHRAGRRQPVRAGRRPHEHLHEQLLREPPQHGLLDLPAAGHGRDHRAERRAARGRRGGARGPGRHRAPSGTRGRHRGGRGDLRSPRRQPPRVRSPRLLPSRRRTPRRASPLRLPVPRSAAARGPFRSCRSPELRGPGGRQVGRCRAVARRAARGGAPVPAAPPARTPPPVVGRCRPPRGGRDPGRGQWAASGPWCRPRHPGERPHRAGATSFPARSPRSRRRERPGSPRTTRSACLHPPGARSRNRPPGPASAVARPRSSRRPPGPHRAKGRPRTPACTRR